MSEREVVEIKDYENKEDRRGYVFKAGIRKEASR